MPPRNIVTVGGRKVEVLPDGRMKPVEDDEEDEEEDEEAFDSVHYRFGGKKKFMQLATEVHGRMAEHPKLKHFFPSTLDIHPITEKNALFMCGAFGGPEYGGPMLREAHFFLYITEEHYNVFMDIFRSAIKKMNCDDDDAVAHIIRTVDGMRNSIVTERAQPPSSRKLRSKPGAKQGGLPQAGSVPDLPESSPPETLQHSGPSRLMRDIKPPAETLLAEPPPETAPLEPLQRSKSPPPMMAGRCPLAAMMAAECRSAAAPIV